MKQCLNFKKMTVVLSVMLMVVSLFSAKIEAADSAYMSHLTGGFADWEDFLQVDNTSLTNETFTLILYDAEGMEIYNNDFEVEAGDELVVDIKSLGGTATSGEVSYNSNLLNFRLSFYNSTGGGVAEFRLPETLSSTLSFFFSEVGNMVVAWKGIALTNYSDKTVAGKIFAYGDGALLGTADISIPALSKLSGLHNAWFPTIPISQVKRFFIECDAAELAGITISGNSDSSKMLFTAAVPIPSDFTGTWTGTATSTVDGDVSQTTLELTQIGNQISGTANSNETEQCSDIPITGTVKGNVATLSFETWCMGAKLELEYTEGQKMADTFSGSFKIYANDNLNDQGNFTLTRP